MKSIQNFFARLGRILGIENLTVSVLSGLIGGTLGLLELILVVRFLTTDYSALVVLMSAIPKIIGFLDFGISPFIMNFLSQKNFDGQAKVRMLRVSIIISITVGFVVLSFGTLFKAELVSRLLMNFYPSFSRNYLETLFIFSLTLSVLQLIGNIGVAGLWATNNGNVASRISILSDIFSLGFLFYYLQNSLTPSPLIIVLIMIGVSSFSKLITFPFLFRILANVHQNPLLNEYLLQKIRFIPNWKKYGSAFAFTAIAVPLAFQLDNWVVLHYVGSSAVIQLTIYWRLYSYIPLLVDTVAKPFWIRLASLRNHRSDFEENFKLFLKTVLQVSIILSVIIFLLLPIALPSIFENTESYHVSLSLLCATFAVVASVDGVFSIALNSLSKMRQIIISSSAMWISNLTITMVVTAKFGVYGPMVGSVLAVTIFGIILNQRFLISAVRKI